MSDKDYFEPPSRTAHLRVWGMAQMLRGAGLAAAFLIAVGGTLFVIWAVGQFLPEASKQAPSPYSALEIAQPASYIV